MSFSIISHAGRLASGAAALTLTVSLASGVARAAELPRAQIALASAISVDPDRGTATLPLFEGSAHGKPAYYIVTESSDAADAKRRGVNFAPGIAHAYLQHAKGSGAALDFDGAPDFSPARTLVPSATGFPPKDAKPGAVADGAYSPFVKLPSGVVLNAPIVATGDGPFDVTTHANTQDRVVAIDPAKKTVSLLLARGFFNGKTVVYLSTEASDAGAAAIERATFVPKLATSDASSQSPIVALANGQSGASDPQAQGLGFTILNGGASDATAENAAQLRSPLNVLSVFPGAGYTPLWNAFVGVWSAPAVAAHKDARITALAQAFDASGKHLIGGPGGKDFGPAGFVVNCPVIGSL